MHWLGLYVILSAATYRIWRLIALDTISAGPRQWLYNRWPPDHGRAGQWATWDPVRREHYFAPRPTAQIDNPTGSAKVGDVIDLVDGDETRSVLVLAPLGDSTVLVGDWPRVSYGAQLVDCPWCAGLWLAALMVVVAIQLISLPLPLAWVGALSAAVPLWSKLSGDG